MMHSSTPLTFRGAVKALFSCFAKPSIWPEEVDVISATAWLGGASEGNEDAFAAPHCHSQKNAPEYVRSDTSSPTIKEVKGLFSDDIGREGSETGGTAQGKEVVKAEKRREVDAIFAQARKSKSESGWKEAAVAAIALSSYWNGVVENIKKGRNTLSLSEEEATFQKAYWIEKAGVAKVKWLALRPFGNEWKARKDQADMIMTMAMNHVWPTVSKAMKAFIEHPSEARMLDASASAFAATSAFASASASVSATIYSFSSDFASVFTSASASASVFAASAFAAAAFASSSSAAAAASVSASTSVSACASFSASAFAYDFASVSAFAAAAAAASTCSNIFLESAAEASNAEFFLKAIEASNVSVLEQSKKNPHWVTEAEKENIAWFVH